MTRDFTVRQNQPPHDLGQQGFLSGVVTGANEIRDRLAAEINAPVLLISAVTGEGLNHLMQAVTAALDAGKSDARSPA